MNRYGVKLDLMGACQTAPKYLDAFELVQTTFIPKLVFQNIYLIKCMRCKAMLQSQSKNALYLSAMIHIVDNHPVRIFLWRWEER